MLDSQNLAYHGKEFANKLWTVVGKDILEDGAKKNPVIEKYVNCVRKVMFLCRYSSYQLGILVHNYDTVLFFRLIYASVEPECHLK